MKLPDTIAAELFANPKDTLTWGEWKATAQDAGIILENDDPVPYTDEKDLNGDEARECFQMCRFEVKEVKAEISAKDPGKVTRGPIGFIDLKARGMTPEERELQRQNFAAGNAAVDSGPDRRTIIAPAPVQIQGPTVVLNEIQAKSKMPVGEWRRRFQDLLDHPPKDNFYLRTIDGSPIKLEIELYDGRPPFIFTRAYVPMVVGADLGWFAQRSEDRGNFGWKVILMQKSRDEAVKRLGIARNTAYVQTIKIIKMAETGRSLLGEVCEW